MAPLFAERFKGYENICLLCSEVTAEHCHRRLAAEMLLKHNVLEGLKHL